MIKKKESFIFIKHILNALTGTKWLLFAQGQHFLFNCQRSKDIWQTLATRQAQKWNFTGFLLQPQWTMDIVRCNLTSFSFYQFAHRPKEQAEVK